MGNLIIDLGHGGYDPGAVNGSRLEKNDVNIGLVVGKKLSNVGHKVDYTRVTDLYLSLAERSNMENRGNYDYFISFHRDSFSNAEANGVTVYTYTNCSKGKAGTLAKEVVNAIASAGGFYNRGVKEANFHVLRETKCSAILIECGFISNKEDNKKFDDNYEVIAAAISNAILKVIGSNVINSGSNGEQSKYAEKGTFYPDRTINVRTSPTTTANIVATYSKGEHVNYDKIVIGERYDWISYLSFSGNRRYMAIRDKNGDNKIWGVFK